MSENPPVQPEKKKPTDFVRTEIRAMSQILAALNRLPNHRRTTVLNYITDLFEQSGAKVE